MTAVHPVEDRAEWAGARRRGPAGWRVRAGTRRRDRRRRPARLLLALVTLNAVLLGGGLSVAAVRGAVADVFAVPSGSMAPTLSAGDLIVVLRLAYRSEPPDDDDVVVVDPPAQAGARGAGGDTFVKRAVGLPGDVLQAAGGVLLRNGGPVAETYLPPGTATGDFGPVRVQPGHVFVLGDNRADSFDSRFFGQVPAHLLVGEVVQLLRPLDGLRTGQGESAQ